MAYPLDYSDPARLEMDMIDFDGDDAEACPDCGQAGENPCCPTCGAGPGSAACAALVARWIEEQGPDDAPDDFR